MKDRELIAMSTRTQMEHSGTGWVVPEVAARSHANAIFPCIQDVLEKAGISLQDIDYIACTEKPGLLPSLLTGMTVAKSIALSLWKELIWIDHIEAHIFANYLEREAYDIEFPAIVLTVSGWHTEFYLWKSMFELELVGQTLDDAAGEAFDKVSKMMWLGFPGGRAVADRAAKYRLRYPEKIHMKRIFPEVLLDKDSLDFSFSGLKSAVKREVDERIQRASLWSLTEDDIDEIAFEFEEVVTDILTKKIERAAKIYSVKYILLSGWVSANSILKEKLQAMSKRENFQFCAPVKNVYSMDNAAMIGIRAYYELTKSKNVI